MPVSRRHFRVNITTRGVSWSNKGPVPMQPKVTGLVELPRFPGLRLIYCAEQSPARRSSNLMPSTISFNLNSLPVYLPLITS